MHSSVGDGTFPHIARSGNGPSRGIQRIALAVPLTRDRVFPGEHTAGTWSTEDREVGGQRGVLRDGWRQVGCESDDGGPPRTVAPGSRSDEVTVMSRPRTSRTRR